MKNSHLIEHILKKCTDKENQIIKSNKCSIYLNPFVYYKLKEHKQVFCDVDNIYLDGILFILLFKILRIGNYKRLSPDMSSLMPQLFNYIITNKLSIYLIGTTDEFIKQAKINIENEFPELNIAGAINGYFSLNEEKDVISKIQTCDPDVILIGMGTPNQEIFLTRIKDKLQNKMILTCGGFFHQTATKLSYYPEWINLLNLRWLYRIYDEPKLVIRYFIKYPLSILHFLFNYLRFKLDV